MEFFQELGRSLHKAWKAKDWDESVFPELARAALEARPPSAHVSLVDVVRWIQASDSIGSQSSPLQKFGDPDIRVFSSDRFYIEVLCWVDGTTAIHQHGFSGAFHVMAGSSIHSRHSFKVEHRYNDSLMLGRLKLEEVELLKAGQTREIFSGAGLIHALFHLERPSVSVVVRTYHSAIVGPQYTYHGPSVAIDPFSETPKVRKMVETLSLLQRINHPEFVAIARESLLGADNDTAAHLMLALMARMPVYTEFRALIEGVQASHPELAERMLQVEEEYRREQNIILRRGQIQEPEHRFLLALLLNVRDRQEILNLVRAAFPEREPVVTILEWVRTLSRRKLAGTEESLVGVDLEDGALDVLRLMIEGCSDDEVLKRLSSEYSPEEVETTREVVLDLCGAFRQSLLFKPLVTNGG